MGTEGVRRALATTSIGVVLAGLGLTGCSDPVDEARTVQTRIGRLHHVVDVDVATLSTEQTAAITVTYDGDVDRPPVLADLVADVVEVADDLGYPAYPLTLVPATEPASSLTIGAAFAAPTAGDSVLSTWFTVTDALLGSVGYVT